MVLVAIVSCGMWLWSAARANIAKVMVASVWCRCGCCKARQRGWCVRKGEGWLIGWQWWPAPHIRGHRYRAPSCASCASYVCYCLCVASRRPG